MWLGAQMSPESAGPHHACNAFVFEGELDVDAMRAAFAQVIQRHEGLRSTFNAEGTEVIVHSNVSFDLPLIDLSLLSAAERDARVKKSWIKKGQRLFNLSTGPLIQAQLLKLADNMHQLIVTAQMIVCDGWSHYVVFEELSEIYSALREQREPVLREVVPMREYARWQKEYWGTSEAKAAKNFWRSQYKTVPAPLDLPTQGPRPLMRSVAAQRRSIKLSPDFYNEIKRFGRSRKVRLLPFFWRRSRFGCTDSLEPRISWWVYRSRSKARSDSTHWWANVPTHCRFGLTSTRTNRSPNCWEGPGARFSMPKKMHTTPSVV